MQVKSVTNVGSSTRITANFDFFTDFGKKSLSDESYRALGQMAYGVLADINEYVPKSSGRLRKNAVVTMDNKQGFDISWHRRLVVNGTTYDNVAEDVYVGENPVLHTPIKHWTTAGTGSYWIEKATQECLDDWVDQYTIRFVRNLGK